MSDERDAPSSGAGADSSGDAADAGARRSGDAADAGGTRSGDAADAGARRSGDAADAGGRLSGQSDPRYLSRLGRRLREADRNQGMARAAHTLRRLAPGGDQLAADPPDGGRVSDRVARLIAEAGAERPSATRELGLAAIQVWQALAGQRDLGRDGAEVTIVFTDLVGFSDWALRAGDDHVLRLLREVGRVSDAAVARHGGSVVKSLGDGVMAVFADTAAAIEASHEMCTGVSAINLDGYRPQLRTGLHAGRPRKVGGDFIGVDVNVAARVAGAAGGGEVLVSGPALANVDAERYTARRRRFKAKGAPADLEVYSVVPRYGDNPPPSR